VNAAAALLTDGSVVTVRELGPDDVCALPEVVELDINPLLLTDGGCLVVDARVRVAPAGQSDPFLRRLRTT
jgi:hypothetical protein